MNQSLLSRLISEQYEYGSPYYHRFLTRQEFYREFGPRASEVGQVEQYFEHYGMKPVNLGTPMTVGFTGNASSVEAALHTRLAYVNVNGTRYYSNTLPLQLPASIAPFISAINGLDDFPRIQPMPLLPYFHGFQLPASSSSASNATMNSVVNFTHPAYLYTGANFPYGVTQFLNPSDFTVAYNATPLYAQGDMGQNSSIAIVMAQGYNPSDISTFSQEVFNNSSEIPSRLTPVPVAGATGNATLPSGTLLKGEDAFEMTLDIEYASVMAPRAHIYAVYGPSLSLSSLVSAYAAIISMKSLPNVITNSWGGFEDTWWNLYGPSWQSASSLENYFLALSSMGVTIVASSGDSGGFDTLSNLLSPAFPASSPYVLSVGGVRSTMLSSSGSPFPSTPNFTVNVTVAPYGFSEVESEPAWLPDYKLNASYVSRLGNETYWYYGGIPPDGGGLGLSYWFKQPWWQHGPGIPSTGRRMDSDIVAEADFNETVYFAGAWNFFWGGTSFAAPTVAGIVALMDTYLHQKLNISRSGMLQPLIYEMYNDNELPLNPFYSVLPGSNPWDAAAASKNLGWPGGQNWSSVWSSRTGIYSLLTGVGVPDAFNMAADAYLLLNSNGSFDSLHLLLNGTAVETLKGEGSYSFGVVNSSGQPVPGASAELVYIPVKGKTQYLNLTADSTGNFTLNASNMHGYVAAYLSDGGAKGFSYFWISSVASGTLKVSVETTGLMGGFSFFNGFLSPDAPGLSPLMPNTITVTVSLSNGGVSEPVYDALVIAKTGDLPFSSPPYTVNSGFNSSLLSYSPLRSESLTNLTGVAYLETWNVPVPETYNITVSFDGLNASTSVSISPQLVISPENSVLSPHYPGNISYISQGAMGTIVAPLPEGSLEYSFNVSVQLWNGTALSGIRVALGAISPSRIGLIPYVLSGTETVTDANGVASITITPAIASLETNEGDVLVVLAYNSSYASVHIPVPGGSILLQSNFSAAALLLISPVEGFAEVLMPTPSGYIQTSYVGTEGNKVSFYISLSGFLGGNDNITSISYRLDNTTPVQIPLPSTGQQSFRWTVLLPSLTLGLHTFLLHFMDTANISYTLSLPFEVIGYGRDPPPTAVFLSPSAGSYVTGNTTLVFSVNESRYLVYEILVINDSAFNVLGQSSFAFNASAYPGILRIQLIAINVNGAISQAYLTLYSDPMPVPKAVITSPSSNSTVVGGDVTIGLSYSGYFLSNETLRLSGPGGVRVYNVSGRLSLRLSDLPPGHYTANYTVYSLNGRNSSSSISFNILPADRELGSFSFMVLISSVSAVLFAVGVLAGIFIERHRRHS